MNKMFFINFKMKFFYKKIDKAVRVDYTIGYKNKVSMPQIFLFLKILT